MGSRTFTTLTVAATIAAGAGCASSGPHVFGQYNSMSPKVSLTSIDRTPRHLSISLSRPSSVAVFLVIPGGTTRLLYPADSTDPEHFEAGTNTVITAFGGPLRDTSRVTPLGGSGVGGMMGGGRSGRMGREGGGSGMAPRDTGAGAWLGVHGYIMIFAAQEPMDYGALAHRVAGVTVPFEDDDAQNTVAKLIRESTRIVGPWSAYSTPYPP